VVVLPAPFGPSRPNTSPDRTEKLIPSTATSSPNTLRSPSTRMTSPAPTGVAVVIA
jgi:hypothetical protein